MSVLDAECARRNAVSVIHVVPFTEPLQALPGVKAALRGGTADIADLQARLDCAANNLVVLLGRHGGRWKPRTSLQEYDLRELIALWSEVKAALEARRLSPVYGAVRRAISSRINHPRSERSPATQGQQTAFCCSSPWPN
jgi:hypothetical protein